VQDGETVQNVRTRLRCPAYARISRIGGKPEHHRKAHNVGTEFHVECFFVFTRRPRAMQAIAARIMYNP
jgi:hypothetical protein